MSTVRAIVVADRDGQTEESMSRREAQEQRTEQ